MTQTEFVMLCVCHWWSLASVLGWTEATGLFLAWFPGLLTPVIVACSTASDKRWGEKAWERGYPLPRLFPPKAGGGESLVAFARKAVDFQHLDLEDPIRLQNKTTIAPRLFPLQLLLLDCIDPLQLLLPVCVRFSYCSPLASACAGIVFPEIDTALEINAAQLEVLSEINAALQ